MYFMKIFELRLFKSLKSYTNLKNQTELYFLERKESKREQMSAEKKNNGQD